MAISIEPTFLIVGALVFVAFLGFILRAASTSTPEKVEKPKKVRKVKSTKKEKKPKKTSSKKGHVDSEPTVWTVEETNEEEEVLEFLKGKDANVLAKELAKTEKNKKRKNKSKKSGEKEQEDVSEDDEEGYVTVARKAAEEKEKKQKEKKKKTEESEEKKKKKPFFKPIRKTPEEIEAEKKKREEERAAARLARRAEAEERRAAQPEEKTAVDRPRHTFAEAEHITYETASVEDLLNSITKAYKPASSPLPRVPSIFSKLKRNQVLHILSYLGVADLVALSRVNHHLSGLARNEGLWEKLARRDLKLQSKGSARTWRAAYRAAYRSPKAQ